MASHRNTPDSVLNSSYLDRKGVLIGAFGYLGGILYLLSLGAKKLGWLPLVYLAFAYPLYGIVDYFTIHTTDINKAVTLCFAIASVIGILAHWMQAFLSAPRADLSAPLVRANLVSPVLGRLGKYMLAYGLVAFFVGPQNLTKSVWLGSLLTLAVICLTMSFVEPAWGYQKYTHADQKLDSRDHAGYVGSVGNEPTAAAATTDYATPVEAVQPKISFANIYGMQPVKEKLLEPAKAIVAVRNSKTGQEPPANGILMHGEPGNGKTDFAQALAGELKVPFIALTYGDVSSKWIGEMPRLISNCFAYAKSKAPCVLFVDELDSFVRSRDAGGSNEESLKITNTLLTEIVKLRDHRVVLVGATNYLSKLDGAAIREGRFDFKVEITPPDEEARIGIMAKSASKHLAHLQVDQDALQSVAKRWNGFSVSRLLAIVKAMPRYAKDHSIKEVGYQDWMGALREVQGRNGRVPANTKSIGELVLESGTREALNMVANRLKDAERIESLGGTLPSGVLFFGPSGTGKTASARALAKECGWAFLSCSGPDLISNREKLAELHAEAKDIRPTIVFIDEADEILRNRQYSNTPELTNRLLVLMDGADEKVKDVVFIAATNHPDQIDPALLRAGRFTEKVEFTAPPSDQIPRYVAQWLKGKKVMLSPELDAWEIASMLEGQTIANIDGVLQYALNRAIHGLGEEKALILSRDDIRVGMNIVLTNEEAS